MFVHCFCISDRLVNEFMGRIDPFSELLLLGSDVSKCASWWNVLGGSDISLPKRGEYLVGDDVSGIIECDKSYCRCFESGGRRIANSSYGACQSTQCEDCESPEHNGDHCCAARNKELEKLRGELEDAELELREKDDLLEKKEEELQALQARKDSCDDETEELMEKDKVIQEQADQMEDLRDELRRTTRQTSSP